ncbi:MAG: ribosome small subunit-dependent GTPase A [Thiomonas arsenitoxydans]|jgi:ribosome biogenesis GTPase|uniref:Small ribosomal subunit biogenesis GTPase RsgA n=1 Tax=Thiomonas arsenitoxydans (strain DSM 22701 / CIP 110005 / 3As) TaxID=426114 RepID=A0A8I1MUM1_THIA3|nr:MULTISPECIES: ribosome small subunit-dependent GTPase A [Thiomonas]MBN8743140.1 ribosome small subunit-dependent GTPase A [Thiomonas arsenitoxydans]MDD4999559.1 ribosome small subunit-dependent GTPase A [Thiomonas arsenitoxydans]ODU97733.1 MAG: ribosome small subunit-dependent GTPase A [Thiomonas sp. SCN 64-16]CQR41588.1 putative ribosome biogenesis GTPase RsgA [Thiomonas sp. CB3]
MDDLERHNPQRPKGKRSTKSAPSTSHGLTARIVGAFGRHYLAQLDDGTVLACVPRGKRAEVVCGDRVTLAPGDAPLAIEQVHARRNALWREDLWRSKMFAANLDRVMLVTATYPGIQHGLIGRALIAADAADIPATLLLNKCDLPQADAARAEMRLYRDLGYEVLELSVRTEPQAALAALTPLLSGQTTLLLGASGVGKSSLTNLLAPQAQAPTREISEALSAGKHTTTATRLYDLPGFPPGSVLMDSPGFQSFGLHHLSVSQLQHGFPEIRARNGQCRFQNCTHRDEPGCVFTTDPQAISASRLALYRTLYAELTSAAPR